MKKTRSGRKSLLTLLFVFISGLVFSQHYVYVSPQPESRLINPQQAIALRTGLPIDKSSLDACQLRVIGSDSGFIEGKKRLASDGLTLIFEPATPYQTGECVQVSVGSGLKQQDGTAVAPFAFRFYVSPKDEVFVPETAIDDDFAVRKEPEPAATPIAHLRGSKSIRSTIPLPGDFPPLYITANNDPAPGNYFLFSSTQNVNVSYYMMILDQSGTPVFYRKNANRGNDLKLQRNGYMTYFDFVTTKWTEMDSAYHFRRYYLAGNGYTADAHELVVNENSDYWLMIYDAQPVDMSLVVDGGNPNAIVIGLVVQHCDADGDVLFQWRSWDHFDILDCDTSWVNLTAPYIDYVHGNAITLDEFNNPVISSRKYHEITKINGQTGDIIWRWGGSQNMFTMVNDDRWFSAQHSIRYQGNQVYTMFDNGFRLEPEYSRGLKYRIDEETMTATRLQTFENDPPVFSWAMGHMQVLPNENVVLGWATNPDDFVLTEYHPDGTKAFEIISADSSLVSYRAFKFSWENNIFEPETDSLNFGTVDVETGNQLEAIDIHNKSNETLLITDAYFNDPAFSLVDELPISIPSGAILPVQIAFNPSESTAYVDTVYFATKSSTEMIAVSVKLFGEGILTDISDQNALQDAVVFPNPVLSGQYCTVKVSQGEQMKLLKLSDLTGRQVSAFKPASPGQTECRIFVPHSGYYMLYIESCKGVIMKPLLVY